MLVGERMSHPVITVSADAPIMEAFDLLKRENIRRAPVIKDGKLVGIISDHDLLNATPSQATTLSVYELPYLLGKIKVREVMTKEVISVTEDTPIEEAARIMADNKFGGLPVLRDGHVVGMITETDLFKIFLELMGAREKGVRATFLVEEKPGQLAKLAQAVANLGGNFIAFGQFSGEDPSNRLVTFKVSGLEESQVRGEIEPFAQKIVDLRTC
jgi:acetoin utilization protein AcuB